MRKYLKMLAVMAMLLPAVGLHPQLNKHRRPLPVTKRVDLTITDISVNRDCRLTVTVKNNGPGPLPASIYKKRDPKSAGVYVYINGKSWGGKSLLLIDKRKQLRNPGGSAVYTSRYKVTGPVNIKAVVDLHDVVKETDEKNNVRLHKQLVCNHHGGSFTKLPDLMVKDIKVTEDCRLEVSLQNIGAGPVPEGAYTVPYAVTIQMHCDAKPRGGIILDKFDSTRRLRTRGGIATYTWFPRADNLILTPGTHKIVVTIDKRGVLNERNRSNNTLIKKVSCNLSKKQ
ncbi:MAG: hypothetical protein GY765_11685 [bacterium]|nr:hypothetical protein [bacterium]